MLRNRLSLTPAPEKRLAWLSLLQLVRLNLSSRLFLRRVFHFRHLMVV